MAKTTVAGRELILDFREGVVRGEMQTLRLPATIAAALALADRLLIGLNLSSEPSTDSSFEIDEPTRDLVAVTPDCRLEWVVEPTPSVRSSNARHRVVSRYGDRILTRPSSKGPFCEIDPETGDVVDHWGASEFTVSGKTHELDAPVIDIRVFRDKTVINTDGTAVVGFGPDGERLWTFDDGNNWLLGHDEDHFYLYYADGGRTPVDQMQFEFDTDAGAIVRAVDPPAEIVRQVMGGQ